MDCYLNADSWRLGNIQMSPASVLPDPRVPINHASTASNLSFVAGVIFLLLDWNTEPYAKDQDHSPTAAS